MRASQLSPERRVSIRLTPFFLTRSSASISTHKCDSSQSLPKRIKSGPLPPQVQVLIKLIEKHGREPGRGHSYLVREWFDGISLRDLMAKGKLAPERAIPTTVSICEIAAYVHSHGVVLRDLEPEHILVGENDQVRLIHVGVTSKLGARRLTFTKLSQVIGTSRYISPEELLGKHADICCDVYSIGVMFYELVMGQSPFPGLRIEDRLESYPVPPRELDPGISPQLQEAMYRALERDPQNRYASAH
jgi:serine/threonine protein kinase